MIDLTPLIEFIEKQNKFYNDLSLMLEEQNKSLSDIPERLDKITEAQK